MSYDLKRSFCFYLKSPDYGSKKHIEIILLSGSEEIVKAGIEAQKQFARDVLDGVTEEERDMRIRIFGKICRNADKHLKNAGE